MKNKIYCLLLLVFSLALTSCAVSSKRMNDLSIGMSKKDVREILGEPVDTRATQGIELLHYELFIYLSPFHGYPKKYFVRLENGNVTEYGQGVGFEPGSRN